MLEATVAALQGFCDWLAATSASQLFAAHMAQHLLLVAVAAPLLAASRIRPISLPPVWAWLLFVGTFLLRLAQRTFDA